MTTTRQADLIEPHPDPLPRSGAVLAAARGGPLWQVGIALVPATALALFWRVWQQLFAFEYGLDVSMPGFGRYWLSIFLFNLLVLPAGVAAWYAGLWLTGRRLADAPLPADVEIQRIWRLWLLLLAFCIASYWGGSYFTEQDAAWHQVTLRDTAFTPSHIALFYGSFPLMLFSAGGAFLYARTRLPHLFGGKALPLSFVLMMGGTVLLLFQVAFNEFGHTFWETEEIFNAPLHWPFVLFAFLLASTFAVFLATVPRLFQLLREGGVRPQAGELTDIGRRWDLVIGAAIVLLVAAAAHMTNTLFAGEWSFWADWKDRQWWPLVTPAVNMILPAAAQYVIWKVARLPIGATLAALCLVGAQWISRAFTFELWANLPLNYVWPETVVLTGVLLDVTLLLTRSFVVTSLVGGLFWGGLFWAGNWPLVAPFHRPVVLGGHVLTIADLQGFTFPRSQGPQYLRIIEEGHLRALVGNVTGVVAFFAAMLSAITYWVGIAIGRFLAIAPIGRFVRIQTDVEELPPPPAGPAHEEVPA